MTDADTPSTSDSQPPAAQSVASKPKPRKRRARFWIILCIAIFVLVPALLLGGAWGYINFGFLGRSLERRISQKLGSSAHVGNVKSDAFEKLSIRDIAIQPSGQGDPLTVGATKLDFGLFELLTSGRLRSLTIERPRIDLRYDSKTGWNHTFKPNSDSRESVDIGRFEVQDGELSFAWSAGGRVKLTGVNGFITDAKGAGASPFSLRGVLDSNEPFTVDGHNGPGAAFMGELKGSAILERDVPAIAGFDPGVTGSLLYNLTLKRDDISPSEPNSKSVSLDSVLNLKNLVIPIPSMPGQPLVFEKDYVSVHADAMNWHESSQTYELRGVRLGAGKVAALSSDIYFSGASLGSVLLADALGTVDLAALNNAFQPRLFGDALSAIGEVKLSVKSTSFSLDGEGPPPNFDGRVHAQNLRLSVAGFGELPPLDLDTAVQWPALKTCALKLGDFASVAFGIDDVRNIADPNIWGEKASITALRFDFGRLGASVLGRRLLAGTPAGQEPPPASATAFPLAGILFGNTLETQWLVPFSKIGASKLRVTGLNFDGISLLNWPLPLRLPEWQFAGPVAAELDFAKGAPSAATLSVSLTGKRIAGTPVNPFATAAPGGNCSASFKAKLERGEDGAWTARSAEVPNFSLPLASLAKLVEALDAAGLSIGGDLKGSDILYDAAAGEASGTFQIAGASMRCAIPERARSLASEGLTLMDYGLEALALKSIAEAGVKDFSAQFTFRATRSKVEIEGAVPIGSIFVKSSLWFFDKEVAKIPAGKIRIESTELPSGTCTVAATLSWPGGKLAANMQSFPDKKWSIAMSLNDVVLAGNGIDFSGLIDLANNKSGPFVVTAGPVNVADIGRLLALSKNGIADGWSGAIRKLRLAVDPISLVQGAPQSLTARLTGEFADAALEFRGNSLGKLDGTFALEGGLDSEQFTFKFDPLLTSYSALLYDGAFLIPPPRDGSVGEFHLHGAIPRDTFAPIRIDVCKLDLGGLVKCSASGSAGVGANGGPSLQLKNVSVTIPNLDHATQAFGPANLKNREPWFGDIKLGGKARFAGACSWESAAKCAFDGAVELTDASFRLGVSTPFVMQGINGSIPISIRRGDATPRNGGPREKIVFDSASFSVLSATKQSLEIEGRSNGFTVRTPLKFDANFGGTTVGPIDFDNLFPQTGNPRCEFQMGLEMDFDQLAHVHGVNAPWLKDCPLNGAPIHCALVKTDSLRGPWELVTGATPEHKNDAELTAPFLGGKIVARDFNARGIFGPAPSFGGSLAIVGNGWPQRNEGVNVQNILKHYPQYGHFDARLTAHVYAFETSSLELSGIQGFVLDVDTGLHAKDEFWFDGNFAMALDRKAVREKSPNWFSDADIRKLEFGIHDIGMQFRLYNGYVYGPGSKLPGGLILRGYGGSGMFGGPIKKDIPGFDQKVVGWLDAVNAIKEKLK